MRALDLEDMQDEGADSEQSDDVSGWVSASKRGMAAKKRQEQQQPHPKSTPAPATKQLVSNQGGPQAGAPGTAKPARKEQRGTDDAQATKPAHPLSEIQKKTLSPP